MLLLVEAQQQILNISQYTSFKIILIHILGGEICYAIKYDGCTFMTTRSQSLLPI